MTKTRDRIVVATNELFRRQGYNGTSLKQISAASEATIGSIYHFFPGGKEALGVAVIDSTAAVYRELFESIVSDEDEVAAGFRAVFVGAAVVLEETDYIDPCPIGTIAREAANTSEPLRVAAAAAFDGWVLAATERLESAGLPADAARDLAQVMVSSIEGAFVVCRAQRDTSHLHSVGAMVEGLIEAAFTEAARSVAP